MKTINDPKEKILILDNSPNMTGALKSILNVASFLKEDFEFHFLCARQSSLKIITGEGFTSQVIPFIELQKNWKVLIYLPVLLINSFRVASILKKKNISIVHVNDLYNMVGVVLKLLRPSVQVVYHVRLLPNSYARKMYRIWIRLIKKYSDAIICVSNTIASGMGHSKKVRMIYDALPPLQTVPQKKGSEFTFFYPGNFIPGKGQNHAIKAFKWASPKIPNATLLFAGSTFGRSNNDKYLIELKKSALEALGPKKANFTISNEKIDHFYGRSTVTLNFSESESFSMTCLESLLAGTPVIATKCGGPEEIISHEENGLLVDNRNIEEMASAMVRIYHDTRLLDSISNKSEQVLQKFSIEKSSKALSDVYSDLISNK